MDNVLNVPKFREILRKSTLDNSIDRVQMKFEEGMFNVAMKSQHNDIVIVINMQNDFLTLTPQDNVVFNFVEPDIDLKPYLNIIDTEEAIIKIFEDEKIIIKAENLTSSVHLKDNSILERYVLDNKPKDDIEKFASLAVDQNFSNVFDKIKKIGNRFGKIYINVENGVLSIETTDKSHNLSNGLKFNLFNVRDTNDLSICFDFKNFVNLMNVIDIERAKENGKEFTLHFSYIESADGGMIHAESSDKTENYYLLNRER